MQSPTLRSLLLASALALCLGPALLSAQDVPASEGTPLPGEETDVVMSDGVVLKTRYSLPEGEGPRPAVLVRLPYNRANYWKEGIAQSYNAQGYAFVAQNTRGTRGSEGIQRTFYDEGWGSLLSESMHPDGVDCVRWLLAQPWCNGRIATTGVSAPGFTAQLLAGATTDLACQFIGFAASDFYGQVAYQGGILLKELAEGWTEGRNVSHVLDEWKAHPTDDAFWACFDAEAAAPKMNAPAIHLGGWFDAFAEGAIGAFGERQYRGGPGCRGNQKLIVGPWTHYMTSGELAYPDAAIDFPGMERRFFAHWLLGVDNGVTSEPAVHYYVLGAVGEENTPGNEWRTANGWPPFATDEAAFYLGPDGALSRDGPPSEDSGLPFVYDPGNPLPTLGGRTLYPIKEGPTEGAYPGPHDQARFLGRSDVLSFVSPPLPDPVEATGSVRARLFVSTTAPDIDLAVKLVDVYPDGRHMLMLDEARRLRFRSGFAVPAPPPEEGKAVEIEVPLGTISLVFNAGHRIGIHVSGGNYPRFEKNPQDGRDFPDDATPCAVATNTVRVGPSHPSALLLPVPSTWETATD